MPDMTPKDLRNLLEDSVKQIEKQKDENAKMLVKIKDLEVRVEAGAADDELNEIKSELSDLRSKMKAPISAVTDEDQQKALKTMAVKSFNKYARQAKGGHLQLNDFMGSILDEVKTLNITNAAEGGLAVASILSMDLIEYAREYSPILSMVGMKQGLTRDFTELVLTSYPSVGDGIENVAGVVLAATTEQSYASVKADVVKVYANPRLTDEALNGTDYNVYADLVRLIGNEITIMLAYKLYYGDGTAKNGRGMLSSSRVDITNLTGKSFDAAPARDPDYFPVLPTGVSASLGATSEAIINFFIKAKNSLPTAYLNGARWCMNRNTLEVVEKVKDADGNPLLINSYMDGGAARIMGYPVDIDDTLPNIAADSTPIIFGNVGLAFAMANGDIDYMLPNPYKISGVTIFEYHKEIFTIMQASDAIIIVACTTNAPA
tara:strand:- start:35574 stop:36872 length:1299 start_codon:yes stop_codon:yes gene_type:complete